MAVSAFFIPPVNLMGAGALQEAASRIGTFGYRRALIVTDAHAATCALAHQVAGLLEEQDIQSFLFTGVQPNPTTKNVEDGLEIMRENMCDFIISVGGGSPHDCAKGIALVASNGGKIEDYEGVDRSAKPQMPLVAINTTAGTASEMTRFCIISDVKRHVKMAIVDKHVTPILSVNDPVAMATMPASLTAATGMDALTHAVEAYVSTAATPITDTCALKAIALISTSLRRAVADGQDMEARENMAFAQFLAGMAFNNASLGYVHAMAHQLGGFYNLPHGVCNAILLPHVEAFNAPSCAARLADVAVQLGAEASADAALAAIRKLSAEVGIPTGLAQLGVKEEDLGTLADNALKDACGLTNPVQPTHEQVINIYRAAM